MVRNANPEQESWWVLRAQSGDREALDALLQSIELPLYRYILSLVREDALAEDVLQEVFLRIYRKLGWLREPQVFRAWAYRIATRESFRQLKKERQLADRFTDESAGAEANLGLAPCDELAPELMDRLHNLVARLSPASRAVIVLYYLHGMSLDQTAAVLGIPLGTVKSRLAYGLESLRQRFREEHDCR